MTSKIRKRYPENLLSPKDFLEEIKPPPGGVKPNTDFIFIGFPFTPLVFPGLSPKQYMVVLDKLEKIADKLSPSSLPECYCCDDRVMVLFDWYGNYERAVCIADPFHFSRDVKELVKKTEDMDLKEQMLQKSIKILEKMINVYKRAECRGYETHGYTLALFEERKLELEDILKKYVNGKAKQGI